LTENTQAAVVPVVHQTPVLINGASRPAVAAIAVNEPIIEEASNSKSK
jgi:hypothetical protein